MFFVIKHPLTVFNKQKRTHGWADSSLTKEGIEKAKQMGEFLQKNYSQIKKIYSSDLGRCMQTSKIIHKYLNVPLEKTTSLREINYGIYNGALEEEQPEELFCDNEKPSPGGESVKQMKERVFSWLIEIATKEEGDVLLVTHSGIVRMFLWLHNQGNYLDDQNTSSELHVGEMQVEGKSIKYKILQK